MPHQRQIVTCLLILYTDTKDGTLFSGTKMLNSRCATQERKVKRCCGLDRLFPKQKWRVITLGRWPLFVICEQQIILFVGFEWTYKGWSSSFFIIFVECAVLEACSFQTNIFARVWHLMEKAFSAYALSSSHRIPQDCICPFGWGLRREAFCHASQNQIYKKPSFENCWMLPRNRQMCWTSLS